MSSGSSQSVKAQGMVLRRYDYSETSLIVHFFTREFGKFKTLVKGAKKPRGRFFGKLELASVVDMVALHKSRSDLHVLTDVSGLQSLEPLRMDLAKFAHAMVILELVDHLFEVEAPHEEFYDDLLQGMQFLAATPMDLWIPVLLQLKLVLALGLLPSEEGSYGAQAWQVPYLSQIAGSSFKECFLLHPSKAQKKQFFAWTRNILDGVVHKKIRSYDFLAQVALDQ